MSRRSWWAAPSPRRSPPATSGSRLWWPVPPAPRRPARSRAGTTPVSGGSSWARGPRSRRRPCSPRRSRRQPVPGSRRWTRGRRRSRRASRTLLSVAGEHGLDAVYARSILVTAGELVGVVGAWPASRRRSPATRSCSAPACSPSGPIPTPRPTATTRAGTCGAAGRRRCPAREHRRAPGAAGGAARRTGDRIHGRRWRDGASGMRPDADPILPDAVERVLAHHAGYLELWSGRSGSRWLASARGVPCSRPGREPRMAAARGDPRQPAPRDARPRPRARRSPVAAA